MQLVEEYFASVAEAVTEGRFALWVGSGISRGRAPHLGLLIDKVIEHIRANIIDANDANDPFKKTLNGILRHAAQLPQGQIDGLPLELPFDAWPEHDAIVDLLRNRYSAMLNARVPGEDPDYLLWVAADVRATYGTLDDPDAEHFAIAILVLEGALLQIASANWDPLIEVAVDQLSAAGRNGILRVIVNPDDVRDPPARTTLLKFHGCAVACVVDPNAFRKFLVGAERDIIKWADIDDPLRREVIRVATNFKSMIAGLSLQDADLKGVFSKAQIIHEWPWPVAPDAQSHLFLEDELGHDQQVVLQVAYSNEIYDQFGDEIEAAALLRARPRTALPALAIHVISDKLKALAERAVAGFPVGDIPVLLRGLDYARDLAAAAAPHDTAAMDTYMKTAIRHWDHSISIFRMGSALPPGDLRYSPVSPMRRQEMLTDQNIQTAGLDEFAAALALVGLLSVESGLGITLPDLTETVALKVTPAVEHPVERSITFVGNAEAAIQLASEGGFDDEHRVVIHSGGASMKVMAAGRRNPSGETNAARHFSIREILEESADLSSFRQQFLERSAL